MITIGIPTLNGPERLESCLHSIASNFEPHRQNLLDYKVIVLDDCSTEDNLSKNIDVCNRYGIELLMHKERRGVSKSWNTLTRHTSCDIMVLLNDDIVVTRYWLDTLIYSLENNPILGTVGLNAYEGPNRFLGSQIYPTYMEAKLLFGSQNHPILSSRGYAFAFRKEDYLQVNGFDERYFCFFEEIDFNLELLKIGKRNAILNYPNIFHGHGETTTKTFSNPSDIFAESKFKFEDKWKCEFKNIRSIFNHDTIAKIPSIINEWNTNIAIWM